MGAGKEGEIQRNPDTPRQEQCTPEGAGMEGPSGCTSLGSCAGTQLSPQRCGEAGPELQDVSRYILNMQIRRRERALKNSVTEKSGFEKQCFSKLFAIQNVFFFFT